MPPQDYEAVLARLYSNTDFLKAFLRNPDEALAGAPLDERERAALRGIDRDDLMLAARGIKRRRARRVRSARDRADALRSVMQRMSEALARAFGLPRGS